MAAASLETEMTPSSHVFPDREALFVNLQGHNYIFVGSRYPCAVARFIELVIDSDSHVLLHVVVTL